MLVTHVGGEFTAKMSVYPKVKVREQKEEESDHDDELSPTNDATALLFLKTLESLPVQGKENQSNSPPSIVKTAKTHVSDSTTLLVSASKGTPMKDTKGVSQSSNIVDAAGTKSVLRPRAVLSSPDNDRIIGMRNKLHKERSLAVNRSNSGLKMSGKNKTITSASQVKGEIPLNSRKCQKGSASVDTGSAKREGKPGRGSSNSRC